MIQFWIHLGISAVITTVGALLIATVAARLRFSASRGLRIVLDVLFLLPLILPSETSFLCRWCTSTLDPVMALPVLYLCGIAGFHNVSRETLEAAKLQGMGKCGTFWRFFFPAAKGWLLGGAALIFAREVLQILMIAFHKPC